ncbi:MAG TPA: phosphonate C-P lyase system protein PhnG [Microvirga sp.]|jgi:alpha-D-ribose 1-methylphosphonate 5-triphosphate synthase subunit PhnG|nr:phosphonate C-P lyase system protein PhnG [Microvirga sp.]
MVAAAKTDPLIARRQAAMALCAEARRTELEAALAALGPLEPAADLRKPELGLVMARGRIGGDGRAFNCGEVTVARAAVRLSTGETGFAYHLGRDLKKARLGAVLDALMQSPHAEAVERALEPISRRLAEERSREEREIAATRVNFFTLVRGED